MRKFARMRITTAGTSTKDYPLDPAPGGSAAKSVLFMVAVHCKSGAFATIGLKALHGPTPNLCCLHSEPIEMDGFGDAPCVIAGEIDATKAIGEYIFPVLSIGTADANEQWADVEVFEIRKPF